MSGKPSVLRARGAIIDEAVGRYPAEEGKVAALDFIDSVREACRRIGDQPAGGSPRDAREPDISGLRIRAVGNFPYLVFRVVREADIDVWRVLHGARDSPMRMREPT